MLRVAERGRDRVEQAIQAVTAVTADHYFFLRLSMAADKATADAAHGTSGCSIVSAMGFNCRDFGIRVSGLGDTWFTGPHPIVEAKLFAGHTEDEISWMGGESIIIETIGLGGLASCRVSAASLPRRVGSKFLNRDHVDRGTTIRRRRRRGCRAGR